MKQLLLLVLIGSLGTQLLGQSKLTPMDKSPMDIAYYPVNYPILKIQNKLSEPLIARVSYSRPVKNGRKVLGELVEYGKVWRLGANEATELELYRDVTVGGNKVKKGRYTLYALPEKDKWRIVFNKETDTWGAFQYDEKKNLCSIDVPLEKNTEIAEAFTIMFEKSNAGGANLIIAWDDFKCSVPFSL
jgi:hypothetical protein